MQAPESAPAATQSTFVEVAALKMDAVAAGSYGHPVTPQPVMPVATPAEWRRTPAPAVAPVAAPHFANTPARAARGASHPQPAQNGHRYAANAATPDTPLARLGSLAKRYPVGVFGGAAVGALLVGVFLVGLGQVLGIGKSHHPNDDTGVGLPQAAAGVSSAANAPAAGNPTANMPTVPTAAPPTGAPPTAPTVAPQALNTVRAPDAELRRDPATPASVAPTNDPKTAPVAAEPDPTVALAMGHLFAGRLPEAEHAYRDLLTRNPGDATYARLVRILSRRNSADCRPGNPVQTACPTVKP
jgi:hypothetical protein